MLNIDNNSMVVSPFPYLVQKGLFEPTFYQSLKALYPDFNSAAGWKRMSKDLMRGDDRFNEVVSGGPWKTLFNHLNSQAFVNNMVSLYGDKMQKDGLLVDPSSLRLTDYVETREWIGSHKVSKSVAEYDGDKSEVFIRMDFGVGETGYVRPPHLDWRHRVCSLLVYFDDPIETTMEGGRFIINEKNKDGFSTVGTLEPENNMGIFKLDNNNSYHSVSEVTAIEGQRKTLYIAVSSRGQVWPSLTPEG